jgi:hypothetical protein
MQSVVDAFGVVAVVAVLSVLLLLLLLLLPFDDDLVLLDLDSAESRRARSRSSCSRSTPPI